MDRSNIILVGFMGTGKSATGKIVARRLERTMVDMDALIEERAGKKISAIFDSEGEQAFRKMERNLVLELAKLKNLVISAGGGIVLNPDNIRDFSQTGVVVCLTATPEVILKRVSAESHRPLLEGGEKAQKILGLFEQRQPLYDAIALQVDTTHLSPETTADRVVDMYSQKSEPGR